VALAERFDELLQGLPRGWTLARLNLTFDESEDLDRAALILAPATPGRTGRSFQFHVHGGTERLAPTPEIVRRVLHRLDEEGMSGQLELISQESVPSPRPERRAAQERRTFVMQWNELVRRLPPDWSDLYAEVALESSDFLDRGALLLAPVNPARYGGPLAFRFRCARVQGYGVAPEMARRCLERLDHERITGTLSAVRVLSDTHHVATQGPVWYVEGKSV
jgi:hypothetical protein